MEKVKYWADAFFSRFALIWGLVLIVSKDNAPWDKTFEYWVTCVVCLYYFGVLVQTEIKKRKVSQGAGKEQQDQAAPDQQEK